MDTDWCLACGRRAESDSAYCSPECNIASVEFTYQPQPHSHYPAIHAWAASIPPGPPPPSSSSSSLSSLDAPIPEPIPEPTFKPKRPRLILDSERMRRPTLCMSTPQPPLASPSLPIASPTHHISRLSHPSQSANSKTLTDSSIATPVSAAPVPIASTSLLGSIANHVKSWVSHSPDHRPTTPSSHTPTKPALPPHDASAQFTIRLPQSKSPSTPSHPVPFSPFPTSLRSSARFAEDDLSESSSSSPVNQKPPPMSVSTRREPRPHQYQAFPPQSDFFPAHIPSRRHTLASKAAGGTTGRMGMTGEEHPYRSRGRKPSRALA